MSRVLPALSARLARTTRLTRLARLAHPARLARLALLAGALWPAGAGAAPPAAGAPNVHEFTAPDQALLFDGKGWGHGVGLCQWGARGRAAAGQSAADILAAYYQGTSVQKSIAPETTIRVLLDAGRRLQPGETGRITGQDGRWQLEASGTPPVEAPAGATLDLTPDPGAGPGGLHYAATAPDGTGVAEGALRGPLVLRPLEDGTRFVVGYKPAADVPGRPGAYYDVYRGELLLSPRGEGLETVNRLPLQDYLKGVAPAEMPASWPAEALKAQVLAARTYAVSQAKSRTGERYDVDDTTKSQVYLGVNVERPNVNALVDASAGEAVVYRGQPIVAYFFSTCAGWTEDNESVWPGPPIPYLRGIQDVDGAGQPFDSGAPRSTWTTGSLTAGQLEAMLNGNPATAVGHLLSLDLSRRAASGRLLQVRATGSGGTKTFSPNLLQASFNRLRPQGVQQLLSTNFDLKWSSPEAVAQTQGATPTPADQPTAAPGPASSPTPAAAAPPPATPAPPADQSARFPASLPPPPPAATATPADGALAPTAAPYLDVTRPAAPNPADPQTRYVSETGHNLGGAFRAFYDAHGGLDVFGLPRSEELVEDGKTVQYFQRARFERQLAQPGTPYEVQLTLLGDQITADRRLADSPPFRPVAPFPATDQQLFFPETGHSLAYAFLGYWRSRGALDVFGYPISEELDEANGDGSGRSYTVQYFQRARFEYHPELAGTPYEVQLGLLGDQVLRAKNWLP